MPKQTIMRTLRHGDGQARVTILHEAGNIDIVVAARGTDDPMSDDQVIEALRKPISTRQYARLVEEWINGVGLRREDYGTHSLRRTKAAMTYKQTGNLRAVQILLGHTKIESTVRYLGVDVEDALTLAERTEI